MTATAFAPQGRPLDKRWRMVVAGVVFVPPLLALGASVAGGWRYSAGLETAAFLFLGTASVLSVAMLAANCWPARQQTLRLAVWRVDILKHRLAIAALFLAFGAYGLWNAANDIGDWFVPPDTRAVVIDHSFQRFKSGVTLIYTTEGTFSGPWFVSYEIAPGPARLTLGHFSGHVLAVEQTP